MNNDILLAVDAVNRTFTADDGGKVEALRNVSLSVRRGEFVSFIGASGCGKTTLLRLIAGLDKPESGSLTLDGHAIVKPDPERGVVFQQGSLFPWLTVAENIAAGLKARRVFKKERHKVAHFVDLIGLNGFADAFPHQISGGMAQRVAIARALINNPALLLMDEPMGALDSFTRADIQDKILELRREHNTTMLLVTHDVDEAIYLSDRIVVMTPRPGKVTDIVDVRLPHPRHRGGTEFLVLRRELLEKLHLASAEPQPEYNI